MRQSRSRGVVARITVCVLLFGCVGCVYGSALERDRTLRQVPSEQSPGKLIADRAQGDVDSTKEAYYAVGDTFLTASFDLMDQYWSEIAETGDRLLRGHLDNYLPMALRKLNHKPAEAMMRSASRLFLFGPQSPDGVDSLLVFRL